MLFYDCICYKLCGASKVSETTKLIWCGAVLHPLFSLLASFLFCFPLMRPSDCRADISDKTEEDSANDEAEIQSTGEPVEADDACFMSQEISIIKSLLLLAPPPSSRETKKLLNSISSNSVKQIYAKILTLTRATNKEFVHYLGVMLRFPHKNISFDDLVDVKFTAQDKYLNQLVYIYFSIVEQCYGQMNYEQRLKVLFRYVFLFSSHITLDLSIYQLFANVLRHDFLHFFVNRKLFLNFPFTKEFILDFAHELSDKIVKVGYELPMFRSLVYFSCFSCPRDYPAPLDWIVKRWNIQTKQSIPSLFYRHDCVLFLEPVAHEAFQGLDDPLSELRKDLKSCSSCCVCFSQKDSDAEIQKHFQIKQDMALSVDEFNKSSIIRSPLSVDVVRLLPSIDIKSLGVFLCKEKNLPHLIKFAQSFDFKDMDILEALRTFLSSFVMGGESQVIDRVITVYANEFVNQNIDGIRKLSEDLQSKRITKHQENCKRIAYGFIVLNTMMFNPTIEKRLTFEDFLRQLNYSEADFIDNESECLSFDMEDLHGFYNNIQDNEMKVPGMWVDGYDKFQLFKKQLSTLERSTAASRTPHASVPSNASQDKFEVCDKCVTACYKHLFRDSFKSFMFLAPESFFTMSLALGCKTEFEYYIDFHKKDISRFLESSRLYIENFYASQAFISTVLDILEKTEKPKTSVLPDIKSMFSKASTTELKDKPVSTLSQFISAVNGCLEIRFSSQEICNRNCMLLSSLSESRRNYVRRICSKIIINNSDMIDDFSQYSNELQLKIVDKDPERNLCSVSDSIKAKFLVQEFRNGNITEKYSDIFNSIEVYNQDAFDAFCMLQTRYDNFSRAIRVYKITDSSLKEKFCIDEKFQDQLSSPANILKLFTSSSSVLNVKFTKKIHKDVCPVDDPKFNEFDKIVYLVLKCDRKDRTLVEYASCVINYLSDSLVLLVSLYEHIFPVFFQISPEFSNILIKILIKRIKVFIESGMACCEATKDHEISFRVKRLVGMLQQSSLISETDLKSFGVQVVNKPDIVEL